jgi:hypothetical protein
MKTIVAGGRDITDFQLVVRAMAEVPWPISEVVSGACRGVDLLGEQVAANRQIPIKRFPADWEKFGLSAGPMRNAEMAEYADALILIWDGKSKGSANMLKQAKQHNLRIYEVRK